MAAKPEIAFIGLGAMGFGMATHLVKQGYPVTGFDVWPPTLERFRAAGGSIAPTPAEAVRGRDHIVCMVATAAQAQSVFFEGENPALNGLSEGASLLLCSTVPCAYVQSLEAQLVEKGRGDVLLVDCPVSGGASRAADGTLSIMAGGSDNALEKGRFLLQELSDSSKLYIVNGGIGAGSNMKMVHQVLAAVKILAVSEGMGFAQHLGLDLAYTLEGIQNSDASAWMFGHRAPRILTEFKPIASAITIILKDAGIITSEALRVGFSAPMTGTAEQVYLTSLGRGYGADDDSSLIRLYTEGLQNNISSSTEDDNARKLATVQGLLRGIYLCATAESLAFAKLCGLDLDQVYDLCVNAAGGSKVYEAVGSEIIGLIRGEQTSIGPESESLQDVAKQMKDAVVEAQRLKVPLYLGTEASNLICLALQHVPDQTRSLPRATIAKVWAV
ncbi:NAD binding domain of 6-phosphogluconate dehydrogenase-domain-containing protein [Xylaria bambusicola]|uniref:NAD binding domain of 6-phosphogluconate dehydrogenase-domain-containing protein n=1 Tax=Xylaria bambusicola TaxID=326684 RepID=UPI002007439A|nr:NAD binding domain of 6-phosphogluconate dehydrogenase-domain-containing protein [Xylaria bambusicola]KAI0506013.1 NAD binding domain of 6-phosphogluconate dehydrogenase-domain-containing protein [Xylaria bambusicola]